MASDGFWVPFDPAAQAKWQSLPESFRRGLILRDAADVQRMADQLSTEAGQLAYVEGQLLRIAAGWRITPRKPIAGRHLWHLEPPKRGPDQCGFDLALVPAARLILLTHSNAQGGAWARTRITRGTTANFLELEALVQCDFDLLEFIELTTQSPQNFDSPT